MGTLDIIAEGDRWGYRDTCARGLTPPTCPCREPPGVSLLASGVRDLASLQDLSRGHRGLHQLLQMGHHPGAVPRHRQLHGRPVRLACGDVLAGGLDDI